MNNTLHKLSFSYIFNFKKDKAFSVSTILSSLALILGISILITVMSVMNGFREQLVESLSGVNGDITIYDANKDKIKKIQEKNPSISFVENIQSRVITSNENGIEGLLMKSLNKEDIYKIPKINQNIFEIEKNIDNWVFIGVELARSLNLKVGMPIQINIPGNSMTILGPVLNSRQLTIKGIFNTGVYDFDKYFIFSNIDQFKNNISNKVIDVYLNNKDFDYSDLDGLNYSTWEDQNQTLAQALSTEKNVMFVILFFIIVISSFTIISNQIFFIKEKYKDIILLKALGIKQSKICFIFFLNSFFISFFSIVIGTCLGLLLSTNIDSIENFLSYLLNFELWNNEIRYLTSMPYSIKLNDIVFIVSISLFSSLVASYIPILRIFRIKPNLILR
ncbi:MAG: multidrug ABC transporter substrate-binding protein [Pelagibacteraceae bacterium]|nr:MAG: multidrug ABC transporter substrate-binding protein [Pelagibacteraceae bacterium]